MQTPPSMEASHHTDRRFARRSVCISTFRFAAAPRIAVAYRMKAGVTFITFCAANKNNPRLHQSRGTRTAEQRSPKKWEMELEYDTYGGIFADGAD